MKDFEHKDYFNARYCFKGDEIKVASLLDSYAQNQLDLSDVNNIFQLYHTKIFFEKVSEVSSWDDEKYNTYKSMMKNIVNDIRKYFESIDEENIVDVYNECYVTYRDDFLRYFFQLKVYEKISKEKFIQIIKDMGVNLYKLLRDKSFVAFFDEELTELLKDPKYGVGLLVDYYLSNPSKSVGLYLPKSLTPEIKYQVINDYIDSEHVNGNLLHLVMYGKGSKDFPIDDKIRFKAKKRFERIIEDPGVHKISYQFGMSISFKPDLPDKSVRCESNNVEAEYNVNWIKENTDYPTLLNNFIYLFDYTDIQMRCLLTSIKSQRGVIEDEIIVDGKTMYKYGHSFTILNGLANAQMTGYRDVLAKEGIYIEDIVKWFFEQYLKEEFNAEGFVCSMPAQTDSLLSKYERFASVMDGTTKQYKLYLEEGCINREFYESLSGSIRYKDIPSYIKHKYVYCNSADLTREMYDVFSNQSALSFIEKTKDKYETLFDLIYNETVGLNDFQPYQKSEIKWLLERGIIDIKDGIVTLNPERYIILYELYYKEVICLQYHKSSILKELINAGEVRVESSLLSELESKYFDYNLNKAEFTNGLDLRNKYIHDTGSLDEKVQMQDYTVLLKLMIILVIKINEDFCLRERLKEEGDFYEL